MYNSAIYKTEKRQSFYLHINFTKSWTYKTVPLKHELCQRILSFNNGVCPDLQLAAITKDAAVSIFAKLPL